MTKGPPSLRRHGARRRRDRTATPWVARGLAIGALATVDTPVDDARHGLALRMRLGPHGMTGRQRCQSSTPQA